MEGLILFLIITFITLLIILFNSSTQTDDYTNKNAINADDIQYCQFYEAKENLLRTIREELSKETDEKRIKYLKFLLKRQIYILDDYVKLDYLYNDGNFRTNDEINYMNNYFGTKEKRINYNKERHSINTKFGLIPFIVVTVLFCILISKTIFFPLSLVIALVPGMTAYIIGSIIGNTINIKNAEEYYIPKDDPRVQDEIAKRRTAIIAGITSGTIVGNHAKNTVKGVTNVDGWSEMK